MEPGVVSVRESYRTLSGGPGSQNAFWVQSSIKEILMGTRIRKRSLCVATAASVAALGHVAAAAGQVTGGGGQSVQCSLAGDKVVMITQNIPAATLQTVPGNRYCMTEFGVTNDAFAISQKRYYDLFGSYGSDCYKSNGGVKFCLDRFLSSSNTRADIAARLRTHVTNEVAPASVVGGWYDHPVLDTNGNATYPSFDGVVLMDIEGAVDPSKLYSLFEDSDPQTDAAICARFGDAAGATRDVFPNAEIAFDAMLSGKQFGTVEKRRDALIELFSSGATGLEQIDTLIVNVYFRDGYSLPNDMISSVNNGMTGAASVAAEFSQTFSKTLDLLPMTSWKLHENGGYLPTEDPTPTLSNSLGPVVNAIHSNGGERFAIWGPGPDSNGLLEAALFSQGNTLNEYYLALIDYFDVNPVSGPLGPIPYVRIPGDVNCDGALTQNEQSDLAVALIAAGAFTPNNPNYDGCLDINGDGMISAADWAAVMQLPTTP